MINNPDDLINGVEIVEPPIIELKKRGRWMTTACLSGMGCVFLFIIGIILSIKLFIGPGPKQIKNLPENFPSEIPLYDQYNIGKITYMPGKYKQRSVELTALVPKILFSPLIFAHEPNVKETTSNIIKDVGKILTHSSDNSANIVQIEWYNIKSEYTEMLEYYKARLKKNGTIESETIGDKFRQITFKQDSDISGTIYIEYDANNMISYAFLLVSLPN